MTIRLFDGMKRPWYGRIHSDVYASPEFHRLTLLETRIYLAMLIELSRHNAGCELGKPRELSTEWFRDQIRDPDTQKRGSASTVYRCLNGLEDHGFLRRTKGERYSRFVMTLPWSLDPRPKPPPRPKRKKRHQNMPPPKASKADRIAAAARARLAVNEPHAMAGQVPVFGAK